MNTLLHVVIQTHTHTHTHTLVHKNIRTSTNTPAQTHQHPHTSTHTHTQRERERGGEREYYSTSQFLYAQYDNWKNVLNSKLGSSSKSLL